MFQSALGVCREELEDRSLRITYSLCFNPLSAFIREERFAEIGCDWPLVFQSALGALPGGTR